MNRGASAVRAEIMRTLPRNCRQFGIDIGLGGTATPLTPDCRGNAPRSPAGPALPWRHDRPHIGLCQKGRVDVTPQPPLRRPASGRRAVVPRRFSQPLLPDIAARRDNRPRPSLGLLLGKQSPARPTSGRCIAQGTKGEEPVAESNLVLHRGARRVTSEELQQYQAPPPEGRWYPLSHGQVLSVVGRTLAEAGYAIVKQQLGVMRDGSRFFATLDLSSPVAEGVSLAVGVRNSVDKSFPLGFCAGSRVFC